MGAAAEVPTPSTARGKPRRQRGGQIADRIHAVRDQQYAALLQTGVVEQLMGKLQGAAGIAAQHWHHGGAQGRQQVFYGAHVIG